MAESGKIKLTWNTFPGIWQLREGPRLLGLMIVLAWMQCLYCLVFRFDRIIATFGMSPFANREGFQHWQALLTVVFVPPLLAFLGRKTPPLPRYGKSNWALVRERFNYSGTAQFGLCFIVQLYLVFFLAAYLAPMGFDTQPDAVMLRLKPPLEAGYLLGSDRYSRDVLSRLIYGSRISLSIGILAVSLSATIGTLVGLIAGYYGSWIDTLLMRLVDLLLSVPRLVLLLVMLALFKAHVDPEWLIYLIISVLAVTGWMGTARIVRGEVLSLRERDFVQAGRALGFGQIRLIFRHIAPNCLAPVIVSATLGVGGTILVEAALSFLGLGVAPPVPTWGGMVTDGKEYLTKAWWLTTIPGLLIVFTVTCFNLLGDGLRDALDPKVVLHKQVEHGLEEEAEAE